jgi:two-component system response regulator
MELLLIEDSPGDIRLVQEALKDSRIPLNLSVAHDGVEAIEFLSHQERFTDSPRPDLIMLDLNLPRKSGREVLRQIKSDPALKNIPIIIFTTSDDERDVQSSYDLCANCYIIKPVDYYRFMDIIRVIENFWFSIVKLPPHLAG